MKKILRGIIKRTVKNNFSWKILSPFIKVANYLSYWRKEQFPKIESQYAADPELIPLLGEPVVKRGPFSGLKCPDFKSFGSTIFPKIIGSYEKELEDIIEKICSNKYTEIIDVGSAEGYYANGLAMRIPGSVVFAYDINEQANAFCKKMAILNGVESRVHIKQSCTAETLASFSFSGKGLIVCDCEGYEKQLFTVSNLSNLKNCDILIETHDFIDMEISPFLIDLFKSTHSIRVIRSVDDIDKARNYDYPEFETLDLNKRKKLVNEGRPGLMEWLFLEPIKSNQL